MLTWVSHDAAKAEGSSPLKPIRDVFSEEKFTSLI